MRLAESSKQQATPPVSRVTEGTPIYGHERRYA